MKINFGDITLKDLDGNEIKLLDVYGKDTTIEKQIANLIYVKIQNLDLVELAREINKGKEIDISKQELEQIKNLCLDEKNGFSSFIRKEIKDFIELK